MGRSVRIPKDLKVITAEEIEKKENRREMVTTVTAFFVMTMLLVAIFSIYAGSHSPENVVPTGKEVVRK